MRLSTAELLDPWFGVCDIWGLAVSLERIVIPMVCIFQNYCFSLLLQIEFQADKTVNIIKRKKKEYYMYLGSNSLYCPIISDSIVLLCNFNQWVFKFNQCIFKISSGWINVWEIFSSD